MNLIGIYSTIPMLIIDAIACLVDIYHFEQLTLKPVCMLSDSSLAAPLYDIDVKALHRIKSNNLIRGGCINISNVMQVDRVRRYGGRMLFIYPSEYAKDYKIINKFTRIGMQEDDFLIPVCSPNDNEELCDILASICSDRYH